MDRCSQIPNGDLPSLGLFGALQNTTSLEPGMLQASTVGKPQTSRSLSAEPVLSGSSKLDCGMENSGFVTHPLRLIRDRYEESFW